MDRIEHPEQTVDVVRPTAKSCPDMLVLVASLVVMACIFGSLHTRQGDEALAVAAAGLCGVLSRLFYVTHGMVYTLTTSTLKVRRGVFARDTEEVPLAWIGGVTTQQTGFDRLTNAGTVKIKIGGPLPRIATLYHVPDPARFQESILSRCQAGTVRPEWSPMETR